MNIILAAGISLCCISCNAGKQVKSATDADTVLLGRITTPVHINAKPAVLTVTLAEAKNIFDSNRKTWLLLDVPQVIAAPDGVYEIYVTGTTPEMNTLTATSPAFVTVLDLYSITSPGAKQVVEVDISSKLNSMFFQKQNMQAVYVTLVFSGNQAADGNRSKNGGELGFAGMRVVQVR